MSRTGIHAYQYCCRAVLEAPRFVAGLDDIAVVCESIQQCRGNLLVAEYVGRFTEVRIGGDGHAGLLIQF